MSPVAEAAIEACRQYDHWAREIARLTEAIGATECPTQNTEDDWVEGRSCFREASEFRGDEDVCDWDESKSLPGRPLTLDEIGARVTDCSGCTRLVSLIRERREARQRLGVAKRAVRRVGRKAVGANV